MKVGVIMPINQPSKQLPLLNKKLTTSLKNPQTMMVCAAGKGVEKTNEQHISPNSKCRYVIGVRQGHVQMPRVS